MSIVKKPWSEMSEDEKLAEVMDLEEAYRNQHDYAKILEDKMETIADLTCKFTSGGMDIKTYIDEMVAIGEWWTNLQSEGEL